MKKRIFLSGLICVVFLLIFPSCKSPTSPEPPEIKYYNIKITYVRVEILSPQRPDNIYCYIAQASWNSSLPYSEEMLDSQYFTKVDEYTFALKMPYRMGSNENSNPHKICFMDLRRLDGITECSAVVATRIILGVVETGFELELQNIVKCDIKIVPYKEPCGKMAIFWLTADGKLKNYK